MNLSFASARAFFEGTLEIGIRVKMSRTYHTWNQDALLYPACIGARIDVEHKHHFFAGFHALASCGIGCLATGWYPCINVHSFLYPLQYGALYALSCLMVFFPFIQC